MAIRGNSPNIEGIRSYLVTSGGPDVELEMYLLNSQLKVSRTKKKSQAMQIEIQQLYKIPEERKKHLRLGHF